MTSFFEQVYE